MKTIFKLFLNSLSGSGLTHGLTLDTITKDEDNQCTLTFTGTAKLGDLTIMVDKEALTADTDSDVLTVPVSAVTLDYATVQSILARLDLIGETLNDIDDTISAPGTGILARLDALENPSEYAGHKRIDKKQSRCYQVNKSS